MTEAKYIVTIDGEKYAACEDCAAVARQKGHACRPMPRANGDRAIGEHVRENRPACDSCFDDLAF